MALVSTFVEGSSQLGLVLWMSQSKASVPGEPLWPKGLVGSNAENGCLSSVYAARTLDQLETNHCFIVRCLAGYPQCHPHRRRAEGFDQADAGWWNGGGGSKGWQGISNAVHGVSCIGSVSAMMAWGALWIALWPTTSTSVASPILVRAFAPQLLSCLHMQGAV